MPIEEDYKKGAKVWMKHPKKVWQKATVVSTEAIDLGSPYPLSIVTTAEDSREQSRLVVRSADELPLLRNSFDEQYAHMIDNLNMLNLPHEASLLHVLAARFDRRAFYTDCDAVLTIFLNPCVKVPEVYGNSKLVKCRRSTHAPSEPHIFSVAEKTYARLERDQSDQSIVFTGESGSGKTENAKHAVYYLLTSHPRDEAVEEKIFSSSVLLEAFGNVATANSSNSSRFGKYLQLQYDWKQRLVGAVLQTYLLDTSRLVSQTPNQQNFGIFHQLYCVNDPELRINQGQKFKYLVHARGTDSVGMLFSFAETVEAMLVLGFSPTQQTDLFNVLSAILHLGNLDFKQAQGRSCYILNMPCLATVLDLLKVDVILLASLRKGLCHKRMSFDDSAITVPRSVDEAEKVRDALARHVYLLLFKWLVSRINESTRSNGGEAHASIGLLDLYGFESLEPNNSLEQFWINYANEMLESFVRTQLAKQLRTESTEEERVDAVGCSTGLMNGILDLVDDRTTKKLQNEEDESASLVQSLEGRFRTRKNFRRIGRDTSGFVVVHFLGEVRYDASGFVDKNSHAGVKQLLEILQESRNSVFGDIVRREVSEPTTATRYRIRYTGKRLLAIKDNPNDDNKTKTVMGEFRSSLSALTSKLDKTSPYYVRCIKTNDTNEGLSFDPRRVARQVEAYGIRDTLVMSVGGYPSHMRYERFLERYHSLCPYELLGRCDVQKACERILADHVRKKKKQYVLGSSDVLLKEETVSRLEERRHERLFEASVTIQKTVRCRLQSKRYARMRRAVVVLQRHVRGFLTRLACERWEHLGFVTLDLSVSFFKAVKRRYFEDNRIGKEVRNYGTLKSPKATAKDPRINVSENSNGVSMVGNIYSQKCIGECENLWAAFRKFDDTANKFIKDFGVTQVEIEHVRALRDRERVHLDTSSDSGSDADTIVTTIAPNQTCDVNQSANHHHDHKGMFEFNVTDVDDLVQHLVAEVNYSELEEEARDLPARAVFMCIRYLDAMDDDRAANSLVEAYAKRAKLAVKAQGSFESAVHWLVQSHRLLNFTKQYSRISYLDLDESLLCHVESPLSEDPLVYHMENTSRQEGHSLCSLELTAERGAIEDVGQWMAGVALEHMRKNTLDLVVPALLDVQRSEDGLLGQNEHLRLLVEKLDGFHRTFQKYGADRRLVIQIFERLFASFGYQALSSFMMRTELFDTLHGTIIRCNIRSLEAWACDCDMSMAIDGLLPIVRTVRLLQRLPVGTSEMEDICADYSELSCDQITYIMIHYKPAQHEEPVSVKTIEGVKAYFASKLRETPDNTMPAYDANRPVKFMFRHSEVHFDEVEMPATINLRMLKKM